MKRFTLWYLIDFHNKMCCFTSALMFRVIYKCIEFPLKPSRSISEKRDKRCAFKILVSNILSRSRPLFYQVQPQLLYTVLCGSKYPEVTFTPNVICTEDIIFLQHFAIRFFELHNRTTFTRILLIDSAKLTRLFITNICRHILAIHKIAALCL